MVVMRDSVNYERTSGDQQTGSRRELGADPYEHVDPFTYRPRMSALDWIKVCGWGRFSDSIAPIASLIVYDPRKEICTSICCHS